MSRLLSKNWLRLLVIFLVAFSVTLVGATAVRSVLQNRDKSSKNTVADKPEEKVVDETPTITTPDFINLQPVVDDWVASLPHGVNVGLMIYDLDHQQVAGSYNPDEPFNSASIYKLFFVYDGYRQIMNGSENLSDYFTSTYDKGDLTLGQCLDLMIRESYNGCADPMRADSARWARVEAMYQELGLKNTSSAGLYASASDLAELLKLYWDHADLNAEIWANIQDSMLIQPATNYNWRQGLPSGFQVGQVYDKVGWNWTGSVWSTYNDAAIVEFPEQNHHYIVVVMTENLPTRAPTAIIELGGMLESAILSSSVNADADNTEILPTLE